MIPSKNVLGNPNVTEGDFQIAIEQLRESVIGSGKVYDSANTYMKYDFCTYNGVSYYSKIDSNIGNTPAIGTNWGDYADLLLGVVHKTGNETIAGVKTFSSSPIVPVPTLVNQVISMGNIIEKTGAGIGYGTGSGGTVTQLTSKSTAVSLNKPCGQIIMNSAALAAGAVVYFIFYNSLITMSDTVVINTQAVSYLTLNSYDVKVEAIANGYCYITVKNTTASSISDPLGLEFTVIKGANA